MSKIHTLEIVCDPCWPPYLQIVEKVAEISDMAPETLPSIVDVIGLPSDTAPCDAFNHACLSDSLTAELSFTYAGYEINVQSSGEVAIFQYPENQAEAA
jgi:hypothetical protein